MVHPKNCSAPDPRKDADKRVEIALTDEQDQLLEQLNATGLYGFTIADTADRLLSEALLTKLAFLAKLRNGRSALNW